MSYDVYLKGPATGAVTSESVQASLDIMENKRHHMTLEERAAKYDGKLLIDGVYNRGEPAGREKW